MRRWPTRLHRNLLIALLCVPLLAASAAAEPSAAALAAFSTYAHSVESRLAQQHSSPQAFLAPTSAGPQAQTRLRSGELIVERMPIATTPQPPGAALYHWRGTAFAPGATVAGFERLMKNFSAYPQTFAPQVLSARVLSQNGDRLQATMRVRQQHVLTVVLDTDYDIAFARLDPQHGYSFSRSTRIAEIASPGTPAEHALDASGEHGFLWHQNTWWSYEERDGGLYMQIESISLTRAIPTGLGWAVGSYVESIPRDSLEFTLRAACNALRRQAHAIDSTRITSPEGSKQK
jgi:hypothetical protein